mmetsp:Transcript_9150/g.15637  ORF Transcript_9150/g.15637 Transcript_9150/m.15637 type:complete len:308 (-) Transcript_9150:408-1331(-)
MNYWRCICGQTLYIPYGAAAFKCPRCNVTTVQQSVPVAAPLANSMNSRISCSGCSIVLSYPFGAPAVICSRCGTTTPVVPPAPSHTSSSTSYIDCVGCRTRLMYAAGAPSVRCTRCNAISNVHPTAVPHQSQSQSPSPSSSGKPVLIVQNPGSDGNVAVAIESHQQTPTPPVLYPPGNTMVNSGASSSSYVYPSVTPRAPIPSSYSNSMQQQQQQQQPQQQQHSGNSIPAMYSPSGGMPSQVPLYSSATNPHPPPSAPASNSISSNSGLANDNTRQTNAIGLSSVSVSLLDTPVALHAPVLEAGSKN